MQEMLDVVNEKNKVVGKEAREKCHKKFLAHRIIQAFVFDKKGRIFVAKRSKRKAVYPGLLDVSIAGHVDAGETYHQAAIREIHEELGIKPKNIKQLFKFRHKTKPENAFIVQYQLTVPRVGKLNKREIESGKFIEWGKMLDMLKRTPKKFAPTSRAALKIHKKNATARTGVNCY
ncbi:MAG: NUDIX domain-containing protein [Candidatus Woesearchaeota archaeon]